MKKIVLGIDRLSKSKWLRKGTKAAVLCHPASVSTDLEHLIYIVEAKTQLVALFGPQHGIHGETQDNMVEWRDHRDAKGRPVFSLYGERRKPTKESLRGVNLVIVDLFDVGARYYTFIYTMAYMMEVCAELEIPILICDRPNPLGGEQIEGPILDSNFRSFVGLYELPMRHGMTIGELALFFAERMSPKPKIYIEKIKGWNRSLYYPECQERWTLPSPNMPNFEAALLYPGMCLLEGTSLSEGRGTTRPFELIGAPFFDWEKIEAEYKKLTKSLGVEPAVFHRQGFIPTFHKYQSELCRGALQIVLRPKKFQPARHMVILLWIFRQLYQEKWNWKRPPYEYEYQKLPIDILAGSPEMRETVDRGASLSSLFRKWKKDEDSFKKTRKPHLIY